MRFFLIATIFAVLCAAVAMATSESSCGENEVYQSCGTACPLTCIHQEPRPCILMCKQGCFCKPGFLRVGFGVHGDLGKCVEQVRCKEILEK